MTSSNFAYALDQDLPALPKWLFVLLADAHGLSEYYDIPRDRYLSRTGMAFEELEASLFQLEDRGLLRIVGNLDGEAGWRVRFTYPGEFAVEAAVYSTRAPRAREESPGWVYIIGTGHGVTKVGITTDLPSRAKSIITNAAVDAKLEWSFPCGIATARDHEKAILDYFAADRFKGEWLRRAVAEVIAVADEIVGKAAPP
jgi:hypothetical protein